MAAPSFFSPYAHGFVRVGVCTPRIRPADPVHNAEEIVAQVRAADAASVGVLLFPELGLSAYAIDDLHLQEALLGACERELSRIAHETRKLRPAFALGLPWRDRGRLYNVAAVIHAGEVLGIVPKSFLPNYREFYEARWFTPGAGMAGRTTEVDGKPVPFGTDLLFAGRGASAFTFHVEICEDGWVATPPSSAAALAGAELLLNLSASNIVIGKAETRRRLFSAQSERCLAAYAYSAAGPGESTTDLAWDGHAAVYELGHTLTETSRFATDSVLCLTDVDIGRIRAERIRTGSFADAAAIAGAAAAHAYRTLSFDFAPPAGELDLLRPLERYPYVPADPAKLREDCYEAWNIQVQGVVERLRATGVTKLVIGVSGGLDSAAALMVAVKAMDVLGHPRTNVLGYTLPGFGTSEATKTNALDLMRQLGVSAATLDIRPAATQMLTDLGHPFARGEPLHDVTFENVQAGLRTDYLFRLANQHGGLVLGTGDLSELGLGWCTYGVGDQMSHYNPNAGVSKTLIQHLIRFAAESGEFDAETAGTLRAVLATEISPELIPADAAGRSQSTEAKIGPYALQDFNLFYLTRFGFAPSKIAYLSWCAWADADRGPWPPHVPSAERRAYDLPTIKRWLRLFLQRFFANQFKRSALPNGPKISSGGSLSPRGDWRMPSDAPADAWLAELEANTPE